MLQQFKRAIGVAIVRKNAKAPHMAALCHMSMSEPRLQKQKLLTSSVELTTVTKNGIHVKDAKQVGSTTRS